MKSSLGIIGMGVMGTSLARNFGRNKYAISIYNRHVPNKEENVALNKQRTYDELDHAQAFDDLKLFIASIERPRKIILMVNAGTTIDIVLENLCPLLAPGDVIVDGGNSHFEDTQRRMDILKKKEIFFIGAGISGGEEGALKGPSIMPSGEEEAYALIAEHLEAIAAKDNRGNPCCTYVGAQGSGHFVKMIHNGIEYAEMQLLAECYALLKAQQLSNEAMALIFESWLPDTQSYLLEITIQILRKKEQDVYILDTILDKAENKGTGKWSSQTIADNGIPSTMIPAALFARYLSFFKEKRIEISQLYSTQEANISLSNEELKAAYQLGRIINHHQGFLIIKEVAQQKNWEVSLSKVAQIWTEGCIIKSSLMQELVALLNTEDSLLESNRLKGQIKATYPSLKKLVVQGIENEIHLPCFSEAINYFNGIKTAYSSANLIQAQRDFFGAHTYKKINDPDGKRHHTVW
jgi:6-phosphogluconate dehydrogenase